MEYSEFKMAVDILASMASFVAIIMVINEWVTETSKALKIIDMTIIKRSEKGSFNLYLYNRKNYPITINHVFCYTKKFHTVNKMVGGKTQIKRNYFECPAFLYNSYKVIETKGYGNLEIASNNSNEDVFIDLSEEVLLASSKKMYIHFDTSHGMYDVIYKSPRVIKALSEVHVVESSFETTNRFAAEFMFFYKKFFT